MSLYSMKMKLVLCGVLLLFTAGCGDDGLLKIEGRVTYDGQPVERGTINFFPTNGNAPTAAAIITNGAYQTRVAPGPKRVQIEKFRVVGHHRDNPADLQSPMIEDLEQTLPAKFNVKTELTVDFRNDAKNQCNFDLNSKTVPRQ